MRRIAMLLEAFVSRFEDAFEQYPRRRLRARMARLPLSRELVHRGPRIPGLRAGNDSPLSAPFLPDARETCHPHWSPAPGAAAAVAAANPKLDRPLHCRMVVAIARMLTRCPCGARACRQACGAIDDTASLSRLSSKSMDTEAVARGGDE
jgi:hypothetical protein